MEDNKLYKMQRAVKTYANGAAKLDPQQPPIIVSQNILVQPNFNQQMNNTGQAFNNYQPYPYLNKVNLQRGSGNNVGNVSPHLVAKGEPYMNKMYNTKPAKVGSRLNIAHITS